MTLVLRLLLDFGPCGGPKEQKNFKNVRFYAIPAISIRLFEKILLHYMGLTVNIVQDVGVMLVGKTILELIMNGGGKKVFVLKVEKQAGRQFLLRSNNVTDSVRLCIVNRIDGLTRTASGSALKAVGSVIPGMARPHSPSPNLMA